MEAGVVEIVESGPSGRPRDPEMERKAQHSALKLFGLYGWSGFTLGAVAEDAHIGKSSLYLRWKNKEDLLVSAFDECRAFFEGEATGLDDQRLLRDQMLDVVRHRIDMYYTPTGLAVGRVMLEYQADPGRLQTIFDKTAGVASARQRARFKRAEAQGELRAGAPLIRIADAIEGSMLVHMLIAPTAVRERAKAQLDQYPATLIATVLDPWLTDVGRGIAPRPWLEGAAS